MVLQSHLVGGTPEAHVAWLVSEMNPPMGAVIVDAGCGFGEVPRLMQKIRPDLRFVMINPDAIQLGGAPTGEAFTAHVAGYENMPVETGSVDCVLFAYSMGFGDWKAGVREAWRVLKPTGTMFCYEPSGEPEAFAELYDYQQVPADFLPQGFELDRRNTPIANTTVCQEYVRQCGDSDSFDRTFAKCSAALHAFRKVPDPFAGHENVALQFSGGKDSIALLLTLCERLDRVTVYFLDTGDTNPETLRAVEWAEKIAPRFVRIQGSVAANWEKFGWPADVVPFSSSDSAAMANCLETPLLQDRYACCWRTIMWPLHERMLMDGVTLIVRGQKKSDTHKGPLESGDSESGITYLYPLENWTDEQVLGFLADNAAPIPSFYWDGYSHVGDCLHCTAWLGGGRSEYLKRNYPDAHLEYQSRLRTIYKSVAPSVAAMIKDMEV